MFPPTFLRKYSSGTNFWFRKPIQLFRPNDAWKELNLFFEICNSDVKTKTVVEKILFKSIPLRIWPRWSEESYNLAEYLHRHVAERMGLVNNLNLQMH